MHQCNWEKETLGMIFINKRKQLFEEINDLDRFDLIYFDAFGYQPDLWSTAIFKKKCLMRLKTMGF
jgi:hypothetical protein